MWNSASPPLLSKEIDHFRPSFHQKIACGAPKNASSPCLTLVAGAARPESATRLVSIIPVSCEGVSLTRASPIAAVTTNTICLGGDGEGAGCEKVSS